MTEPLLARIEDLERAHDEQAADTRFGQCYAMLTTLLIVLSVVPVSDGRMVVWHVRRAPGSVEDMLTFFVLFQIPLLFLLLWVTVRPGRSAGPGRWISGFAITDLVLWLLVISDKRVDTGPAGYALMLVVLAIIALAVSHAVYWSRRSLAVPDPFGDRQRPS